MSLDKLKKIFYGLVADARVGFSINITHDDFDYVRFNYIEYGKLKNGNDDEEYYGLDDAVDYEYEAEYSNGSINYLPTLIVNDKEEFFFSLSVLIQKYYDFYDLEKVLDDIDEDSLIKNIILTILSNARYVDYENPVAYFRKVTCFFDNPLDVDSSTKEIEILDNSIIRYSNSKEVFGYETPYCFKMNITNGEDSYNLPIINYGLDDNTCYIYSIQNKERNEDNKYNKRIKRLLNKINANVTIDTDDKASSILGVTPSFVLTMAMFFKILKDKGIDDVRVVTFLPDRYLEKKATEEYDADLIQHNLTEKLILLFYRLQYHIDGINVNYPLYDGIISNNDIGEDLVIKLGDKISCENNEMLENVLNSLNERSFNK